MPLCNDPIPSQASSWFCADRHHLGDGAVGDDRAGDVEPEHRRTACEPEWPGHGGSSGQCAHGSDDSDW